MSIDHFFTLIGLLAVAWQIRVARQQRQSASLLEIYDINRQLLILGFSNAELFAILNGKNADPETERRYLQLWLNQLSLIHAYLRRSAVDADLADSLKREVTDFMEQPNMQKHWKLYGALYPDSFQRMVETIVNPAAAPQAHSHAAKTWRAIFSNTSRDIRTKPSPTGGVSSEASEAAGMYPCTNTSPLSAKSAAGHPPLRHCWGIAPCSPMMWVIFIVSRFRCFLRETLSLKLLQVREWGLACLIGMEAASI
jgi:hypothetical protein